MASTKRERTASICTGVSKHDSQRKVDVTDLFPAFVRLSGIHRLFLECLDATFEIAADRLGIISKVVKFSVLSVVRGVDAAKNRAMKPSNFVDVVIEIVDFVLDG